MQHNESISILPLTISTLALFVQQYSEAMGFFAASLSVIYTGLKIYDRHKEKQTNKQKQKTTKK